MNEEIRKQLDLVVSMLRDQGQHTAAAVIERAMGNIETCADQRGAVDWCNDAARLLHQVADYTVTVPPDQEAGWQAWRAFVEDLLQREW